MEEKPNHPENTKDYSTQNKSKPVTCKTITTTISANLFREEISGVIINSG